MTDGTIIERTVGEEMLNSGALACEVSTELVCHMTDRWPETVAERAAWDRFVLDTSAGLYMSLDWCEVWWRHYGKRRHLRIMSVRAGDTIVALMPFFIENVRVGLARLKVAKIVGSDFAPTVLHLAIAPAYAANALVLITRKLFEERCDAVVFGPLAGEAGILEQLRKASEAVTDIAEVARNATLGPHTWFTLPETAEAYTGGLNKRQKQNYRRDVNLFNRSFKLDVDALADGDSAFTEYEQFKKMHAAQWAADGKLGHFGDWPSAEAFNDDLVKALAAKRQFRLFRILADGKPVSYQYSLLFGNCCYWRLPARAPEKDWDRFGLGRLGLIKMLEGLITEGVRYVEAGPGHYEYKVQLGGEEKPLTSIFLVSKRPLSRLRVKLFLRSADLLHLLYYRIWFLRIAPKLPFRRRPLWRTWIKSRI